MGFNASLLPMSSKKLTAGVLLFFAFILLTGVLLFYFHGEGPSKTGVAFSVLRAAQSGISEDLKQNRFDAVSVRNSLKAAMPGVFVYVSATGTIFLVFERDKVLILEPQIAANKEVSWICSTTPLEQINKDRFSRLQCTKISVVE